MIILPAKHPQFFVGTEYEKDPAFLALFRFFQEKGLAQLKKEDREEVFYDDWLAYQAEHGIYASLLSTAKYSTRGHSFNLQRICRFMEAFAYYSPSHGYSLQVSFLGIFPLLQSKNPEMQALAVRTLEEGGVFALGLSEKEHGSDLYSGSFRLRDGIASGKKYYIGNANVASIISILALKDDSKAKESFVFFALEPKKAKGLKNVKKIRTLGVRSAFVGEFEVENEPIGKDRILSEGGAAWDAVFGTVNLGKFFLGFGSIGICERAMGEALAHIQNRVLFGKAVSEFPHIRSLMCQAYARLAGMKLFAYRALDYQMHAHANDRRYLLYNSVQKARVSTNGVEVMRLMAECVGAKGFESDTYFELALRDISLIPNLEGSTHINYGLAARLLTSYLFTPGRGTIPVPSLKGKSGFENPALFQTHSGKFSRILFHSLNAAFQGSKNAQVEQFLKQIQYFRAFVVSLKVNPAKAKDPLLGLALGKALSVIAYAELILENSAYYEENVSEALLEFLFSLLIQDFNHQCSEIALCSSLNLLQRTLLNQCVALPLPTDQATERLWPEMLVRFN